MNTVTVYIIFIMMSGESPMTVHPDCALCHHTGINLSNSDRRLMEAAVSQPAQDMMFTVTDTADLSGIAEDFVSFVCEGKLCFMRCGGASPDGGWVNRHVCHRR